MARDVRLQATWAEHEQHRIPGPCPWYCGYQARVWGWLPTSSDPPTQQVTDVPANVFFQSWRNFQCEFAKEITGNFAPATMIISSVRRAVRVRLKFLIARLLLLATKEMSAKHQENDTPVKASHLLLVIAVCQVLVPEHCLLGEPPKHEKFVSFHKSNVEWWPFVTYPAPQSRSTTV